MSDRQDFEDWAQLKWPGISLARSRGWDETYIDDRLQAAWIAWSECRHRAVMKLVAAAAERREGE